MFVDFCDMREELFGCLIIEMDSERDGHDVGRMHKRSSDGPIQFKHGLDVGAFARGRSFSTQSPVPPPQAHGATGLAGEGDLGCRPFRAAAFTAHSSRRICS